MTRYLLDTQIFIWLISNSQKLNSNIKDELEDYNNLLFLSPISLMEIAIKNRDRDLDFIGFDFNYLVKNIEKEFGLKILEIRPMQLDVLNKLIYPTSHKDPFDHTIISQAIAEKICLISADRKFPFYIQQGLELLTND